MHRFWDERYQQEGVYGKAPNPFWVRELERLSPPHASNRLLLPCEGKEEMPFGRRGTVGPSMRLTAAAWP